MKLILTTILCGVFYLSMGQNTLSNNENENMKRLFLIGIMVLSAVAGFAQNNTKIDKLKEQQKVLKLTTELNKLQLEYEKEKSTNIELKKKVADINSEADVATAEFNTANASNTVKDADSTIKKLKKVKSINKKLKRSQKTLAKMEKKIAKLQKKIDESNKKIEFVDNQ